jgi:MFS family permease
VSILAGNKYLALLEENPEYRKLYYGQIVSLLGDWFEYIAVQTLVFELTNSGLAAGLAIIASTLPSFFLIPLAGSVADRFDRRKIMIAMDLVRAGLALSLLLVRTADQIWMVYVFQTLSVLFASFFNPALNAAVPNLVRRDQLLTANALTGATWGTMLAIGSLIGGVTIATLGRDMAFVLNSCSFLASAFFVWRIHASFSQQQPAKHKGLNPFGDFAEGFRYAVARPQVFWLMLVKAGAGLGGGVLLLLTVFAFEVFNPGASAETQGGAVGLLQMARGAGILVGPFVIARLVGGRIGRAQRYIMFCFLLLGTSYLGFGLAPSIVVAMVFVFFAHFAWGSNWTLSAAVLQSLTPDAIRGRIFSMDLGLLTLTLALSTFLTGVAVDAWEPRLVAFGLGATFITFGVLWSLGVWLSQRRQPRAWQDGVMGDALPEERPETVPMGAE